MLHPNLVIYAGHRLIVLLSGSGVILNLSDYFSNQIYHFSVLLLVLVMLC